MLRDESCVRRAAEPLRRRYAFRDDGKPLSAANTIKQGKIKKSTVIVGRKAILTNMMQSLLCHARASKEKFVVRFVDVLVADILRDRMLPKFMSFSPGATYICYSKVVKLASKGKACFSSLKGWEWTF